MLRSSKPDRWSPRYERREMEALSVNIETFISGGIWSQRESLGTRWCYVWSRGAKGMGTTIDGWWRVVPCGGLCSAPMTCGTAVDDAHTTAAVTYDVPPPLSVFRCLVKPAWRVQYFYSHLLLSLLASYPARLFAFPIGVTFNVSHRYDSLVLKTVDLSLIMLMGRRGFKRQIKWREKILVAFEMRTNLLKP